MTPRPVALPRATYRVQLHRGFRLADLEALLGYFDALGISHLYLSPLGRAREGSTHGYDVVDPTVLNPEIGTEEELARLAARCRERGMGLVIDVVPNHMCIASSENSWWNDVLENGPSSPFARYFDIDWNPPKPDLEDKVLLPILGDQYGRVLEGKQVQIERQDGAFHVRYLDYVFPLAPKTWVSFLGSVAERLARPKGDEAASVLELESILTALGHLPSRSERDHRYSRDFTLRNLHDSLAEVIACFPVYRTYVRGGEPPAEADREIVARAVTEAKKRNPSTSESVFDFIGSVLLSEDPESAAFAASFQQLTGPVMAKRLEDTALYRYYPLASLAEVGGDPERFGIVIDAFHEANLEREVVTPRALAHLHPRPEAPGPSRGWEAQALRHPGRPWLQEGESRSFRRRRLPAARGSRKATKLRHRFRPEEEREHRSHRGFPVLHLASLSADRSRRVGRNHARGRGSRGHALRLCPHRIRSRARGVSALRLDRVLAGLPIALLERFG